MKLHHTEWACLRAANTPDGYAIYAQVQRDIAARLERKGLVVVVADTAAPKGLIKITDAGRAALA